MKWNTLVCTVGEPPYVIENREHWSKYGVLGAEVSETSIRTVWTETTIKSLLKRAEPGAPLFSGFLAGWVVPVPEVPEDM